MKIIFYPHFGLHFAHIDIFSRIFFINCCIIKKISIFLHHKPRKKDKENQLTTINKAIDYECSKGIRRSEKKISQ